MTDREALPPELAARPWDSRRNVPVPWMNEHPADGEVLVDFTAINGDVVAQCIAQRRCGVCAAPLGYWLTFVGGPRSAANRAYLDPPLHESCAEASLRLCPHITRPQHRRAPEHRVAPGAHTPDGFDEHRPAEWILGITRDFTLKNGPDGPPYLHPSPFRRLRRFGYNADGVLVEHTGPSAG